jgi:hypothetical protein
MSAAPAWVVTSECARPTAQPLRIAADMRLHPKVPATALLALARLRLARRMGLRLPIRRYSMLRRLETFLAEGFTAN